MTERLRVALVGYGLSGRVFHGPLVRATPGLEVTAIVTGDEHRRQQAISDFPGVALLNSAEEVWTRRDDFDLVVIATLPGSHKPLALAAIDAGLAAVVEKPMAVNTADAHKLIERAATADCLLVPFHNRRWDSDQLTLRKLLDEGALGRVHRYESRFERWRPSANPDAWRDVLPATDGGGLLLDLGTHLVDQALTLFGPVSHIRGELRALRGGADDDVFIALRHASGVQSHLWAGAVAAAPGPRLRVLGSEGAYVVEHLDGQEDALRAGLQPDAAGFGAEAPDRWGRLLHGDAGEPVQSQPGRWLTFYEGVEHALRTGAPPPVRAEDALAALEVLEAARSSAEGVS
jgi:scyllo-inositol 2-dehydrogenase (NADP+)